MLDLSDARAQLCYLDLNLERCGRVDQEKKASVCIVLELSLVFCDSTLMNTSYVPGPVPIPALPEFTA